MVTIPSSQFLLKLQNIFPFSLPWLSEQKIPLLVAVSAILILSLFAAIWLKPTQNSTSPPGPRGLPLVGNLLSLDPELHSYFAGLAKLYGPILKLRLGNKICLVITSPAIAREVLKDHDMTFANRDVPVTGRAASYGGSDIVWTPYGPEWRMLRKVCVLKMLSNNSLDNVYSFRRREIRSTVAYLYNRAGTSVFVGEQIFLTILNVITNMLWGGTVVCDETERERVGAEFRQVILDITALLGKPNISDFYPSLARFDLQGMERKMKQLAKQFDTMFDKMIDQRLKMDGSEKSIARGSADFLQFLLELKDENDQKTPMTMNHLKALLMDMVVGGSDTSSNSIEFTLAEMMKNPQVMRKAQEEVDQVIGKNNIVEESHIHQLPYLKAIFKESLRLHPTLPLLVPHSPSKSVTISGYHVPKGSRIFVNVWAIQRDPSIWKDPLKFDPDRFLDGKGDFGGSDFSYFPFGSGRRICAGIAMAERMVMYSIATLLHSFDWKIPEGEEWDLEEKFGIVLKKKKPLIAIPMPRLSDSSLYR